MKRLIYLVLLAFSLLTTSCLIEDKKLFCESPAERMDAFLTEYKALLESSEKGWLFEYYPEANQSYGGYAYVLNFKDGNVTAYFELSDESAVSTFKMTSDDGPVIAFDTYNENLHFFANPSASQYQGYEGDYEYNILGKSADESEIYLKGRKSGNKLTLKKFSGDDPYKYFEAGAAIATAMTAPAYKMTLDGNETTSCSISGNVLEFTIAGDGSAEPVEGGSAYCFSDTGINFYEPVVINGQEYDSFKYTNETLVSEDGKVVISLVFPPINQQLVANTWFANYNQLGAYAKSVFGSAENYIMGTYGMAFQYIMLGSYLYPTYGLEHIIGGYGGSCGLDYELIGEDKITFKYNAKNQVNGDLFYSAGLVLVVRALSSTFTITTDDLKSPSYVILTDDNNPDNVIKLVAAELGYKQ